MLKIDKQGIDNNSIKNSSIKQIGKDNIETTINIYPSLNDRSKLDFVITNNTNVDVLVSSTFQGREIELKKLREYIFKKKTILVSGMGGIGKTEICKKLFNQFLNEYKNKKAIELDHIGFIKYEDNMDNSVLNSMLAFQANVYEDNVKIAWNKLKSIADSSKLLLIIDNVNKQINEDPTLNKLKSLPCSIILTSRNQSFFEFITYQIDKMDYKKCKNLFISTYNLMCDYNEDDLKYILCELAGLHTLTVKLFACIANDHSWSILKLRENLDKYQFNISYLKVEQESNLIEEYKKLFELSGLNDCELNILEAFSIFPYCILPINICVEWMNKDANSSSTALLINKLYKKGWLEKQQDYFSMHPVISEVIRSLRKPCIKNHHNLVISCTQSVKNDIEEINISEINSQEFHSWVFAESIINYLFNENSIEIARLAQATGEILCNLAGYCKALEFYRKSLIIKKKVLGTEHIKIALNYNSIGEIYYFMGCYDKALEFYNNALTISKKS